ncbi:hypothetical protein [Amycolatopsis sp. 195334CR]|uniref:hypothetical protein n=1 Tax=Amycolatopsis sp. 195334CR TaxID=2814588 RepID=UPI001A8E5428|nr:hypothetical protein [Amycolatopsis sp. 195334CR]MBN6033777.1 hypothetical protein [Amycolatopsis sp. 195334CR]
MRFALHRGARVIATAGPRRAAALEEIGAQVTGYGNGMAERVAALAGDGVARLAGEGVLTVSVARSYPLDQIHEAAELSQSRRPGGKLTLVCARNQMEPQTAGRPAPA